MELDAVDEGVIAVLLSPERLGALTSLTGSTHDAIELHQEALRLGASLMHIIATVEIALRNAVCENLSRHFGVSNWILQPPVPFKWRQPEEKKVIQALDSARRAEYAKLTQAQKAALDVLAFPTGRPSRTTHAQRAKKRQAQIQVADGQIVAQLTLFFWKRLYGPEYEQLLWRTSLKRTFPEKTLTRAKVAAELEKVYQARNRLAHHETVLHRRFNETMNAVDFIIQHLEARTPSSETPLSKLLVDDIADVNARAAVLHGKLAAYRAPPAAV